MGGFLQTRIAVLVFALVLLSTAAATYAIAINTQTTIEKALRTRLSLLALYLRDTVEENSKLGAALHGFVNLQSVIDGAIARDPDLHLVAVLGTDGEVLYSAHRGDAVQPGSILPTAAAAGSEEPEIIVTATDIVARIRLDTAYGDPAGQIILAIPSDRVAPEVERMIALLLSGALAIICGLFPITLAAVYLILRPVGRGIEIIGIALEAIGQGRIAAIPTRAEALGDGGDPDWDAPDEGEVKRAYIQLVDAFVQARDRLVQANGQLQQQERRIARLDSEGSQALPSPGPDREQPR